MTLECAWKPWHILSGVSPRVAEGILAAQADTLIAFITGIADYLSLHLDIQFILDTFVTLADLPELIIVHQIVD